MEETNTSCLTLHSKGIRAEPLLTSESRCMEKVCEPSASPATIVCMIHLDRTSAPRLGCIYEWPAESTPPLQITSQSLRVSAASASSPGTPLLLACIHWLVPGTKTCIHTQLALSPRQISKAVEVTSGVFKSVSLVNNV